MNQTKKKALERLRDTPTNTAHPLRVFLVRRGVTLEAGAKALGWSVRKIKDVTAGNHYPSDEDLADIARALGFADVEDLFPRRDVNGDLIGQHAYNARARRWAASSKEAPRST